MSIRLIALDLDGTLLTTDKRLTKRTLDVLTRASARGIHIVPATGRSVTGLAPEVRDLPFVRYAITVNGAVVWDLKEQKAISKKVFSRDQAEEVWDFISGYHTMQDACIDGIARMEPEYYRHIEDFMPDESRSFLIRSTRVPTEGMRSYVVDSRNSVEKFNVFFKQERECSRMEAREALKRFSYLTVTSSIGNNLEINHLEATKGSGLSALADYLCLEREQVMAFGDGENDISMLKTAGIGVAMENASSIVKDSADTVTLSNDEDGVALAIEKFVL